jgi:hypothetical protein
MIKDLERSAFFIKRAWSRFASKTEIVEDMEAVDAVSEAAAPWPFSRKGALMSESRVGGGESPAASASCNRRIGDDRSIRLYTIMASNVTSGNTTARIKKQMIVSTVDDS